MFTQRELADRKADKYEVTVEETNDMVDGDYGVQVQIRDTKTNRIIREYRDQMVHLELPEDFISFEEYQDYVAKKSCENSVCQPEALYE